MKPRTLVLAFGGNALLPSHALGTDAEQARHADAAARVLADLVRRRFGLLIVHGNGPQVGNLLVQMEEAALKVPPSSLDVAVALSQGSIGYLLEKALVNQLKRKKVERSVVTLITTVVVQEDAESLPATKPIGPFLSRLRARELTRRGWPVVEDSGRGFRKVVPSPHPIEVLNGGVVRHLLGEGYVVIAGGGGGIPVRRGPTGLLHGVEAVIDKDYTASLLARTVGASSFVVLTGVPHIYTDFGTPAEKALASVTASELRQHLEDGQFPAGSMEPKIRAILEYLDHGGKEAILTDTRSLRAALAGRAGTRVYRDRFA